MATISYRPMEIQSVAEMLDPSRPLVKSTLPLTKPRGPRFIQQQEAEKRKNERAAKKALTNDSTSKIYNQRLNERKFLKAQYEFDREKRLAEQTIYRKEKTQEWKNRFATSPFLVDLVADDERIEEEMQVKEHEDRRKQQEQDTRKKAVRNEIIVKALAELPVLDQSRAQKRQQLEEEKKLKALQSLAKVDALWDRKQRDTLELSRGRRERVEEAALRLSEKTREHK
eukprot:NODE_3896_length_876_cov_96.177570_g3743_i0.p1 GENE.NODE_3896_length_876_cov_96.177570_g3743_i0~~NODE_3896_length_876_cov_96.177570_g3743_i0.p1  ORF type:complete len:227 (+),score=75.90 NODE_3896_length_876_cov_96.177570_g3743_i0:82-762(+)